MAMCTDQTCKR